MATSDLAFRVDSFQYDSDSGGPCLDAYRRQQVFRIDSTTEDPRWPGFAQAAAEAGIMSTLSLPLVVAGDGLGALNIYCREENGFSEADEALARTFASYASVALANARVYWRTQRLADQLEEALSTRGIIEQAKGIIIAEQGCSADEAFQLLVTMSQRSHMKLHRSSDRAGRTRQGPGRTRTACRAGNSGERGLTPAGGEGLEASPLAPASFLAVPPGYGPSPSRSRRSFIGRPSVFRIVTRCAPNMFSS